MTFALEILSAILMIGGALICLIGAFGLIRFPDFFSRMHAAGLIDTLGAYAVLGGVAIHLGLRFDNLKLAAIVGLLVVTSPTAAHALARAALATGLRPKNAKGEDVESNG